MKRLTAALLAAGAVFAAAPVASSADSSSPPNCWGQEHATANAATPGIVGVYASGYAHYFHSIGQSSGQAGVPSAKATCPTPPPPPPTP